jgi:hypothetical protein
MAMKISSRGRARIMVASVWLLNVLTKLCLGDRDQRHVRFP